jgi:hypothetical protein
MAKAGMYVRSVVAAGGVQLSMWHDRNPIAYCPRASKEAHGKGQVLWGFKEAQIVPIFRKVGFRRGIAMNGKA